MIKDKDCKICRRLGAKLFLKGEKCLTPKCPFTKRNYPPGQHGKKPIRLSEYGTQLREKQKAIAIYNISEKQLRNYFKKAYKKKGMTDLFLLQLLERRLDNVIFRLGFADSRTQAGVFIRDSHILVNNRTVKTPSYLVKINDLIEISKTSQKKFPFSEKKEKLKQIKTPDWLQMNPVEFSGKVFKIPLKENIDNIFDEQKILQFYSR